MLEKNRSNIYLLLATSWIRGDEKGRRFVIIGIILAVELLTSVFTFSDTIKIIRDKEILKRCGDYHIIYNNLSKEKRGYLINNPVLESVEENGFAIKVKVREYGGLEKNIYSRE